MSRRNVWSVLRGGKLVAVELTKESAWAKAESLLRSNETPRDLSRHDIMSAGFAVVASYLEDGPSPAYHYQLSRSV